MGAWAHLRLRTTQCTEQLFLKISFFAVHEVMPYYGTTQVPSLSKTKYFLLNFLVGLS